MPCKGVDAIIRKSYALGWLDTRDDGEDGVSRLLGTRVLYAGG